MAKTSTFARFRQILLLYVLLMVAVAAWLSMARSTDWNDTLWVAVYPINGDKSEATAQYIGQLEADDFDDVEEFFAQQIKSFDHPLAKPVQIELLEPLTELPPALPAHPSTLRIMTWSLSMRYWSWRMARQQASFPADIKMYVVYFDPQTTPRLDHSVGLRKGLFGVVNAFASSEYRGSNHVVLAHEMMHTLGATDKYHLGTAYPLFPEGFAEPNLQPRWPQTKAEIMGGRIAISATKAQIPDSMKRVIVGPETAVEIRWIER